MASDNKNDVTGDKLLTNNSVILKSKTTPKNIDLIDKMRDKVTPDFNSNESGIQSCSVKNNPHAVDKCSNDNHDDDESTKKCLDDNEDDNSIADSQENARVLIDNSKNNGEVRNESISPEIVTESRKRKNPGDKSTEKRSASDDECAKSKRQKNSSDDYCWRCHKDSVDINCTACPRSWHRKCLGGVLPMSSKENWLCGECASILHAENVETRSPILSHLTIDQLCMVFKYMIDRMKSCPGSEPFWTAVDLDDVPNYMDYVVKPMDLSLLEKNVNNKTYGSTEAFMADAKWIQHNCVVFNTCGGVYADTSKLTNASKQIIKIARQEVSEFEACPDCYTRGRNLPRSNPSWFIETCRQPHPLIWAKLKGFPFWPAKAMPRVNTQGHVDVRFFGEHDRAWVAPKDIFLYSRDPPTPLPRKKRLEMVECIKEITRHCKKLELSFGPFTYAPSKTPYNPNDPAQMKLLLPEYDPSKRYDLTIPLYRDVYNTNVSQNLNTSSSTTVQTNGPIQTTNEQINNQSAITVITAKDDCKISDVKGAVNEVNPIKPSITVKALSKLQSPREDVQPSTPLIKNNKSSENIDAVARKVLPKKMIAPKKMQSDIEEDPLALPKIYQPKAKQAYRKIQSTQVITTIIPAPSPENNSIKVTKVAPRVYKPKAKIVDKLNLEGQKNSTAPILLNSPIIITEISNNQKIEANSLITNVAHSLKSSPSTSTSSNCTPIILKHGTSDNLNKQENLMELSIPGSSSSSPDLKESCPPPSKRESKAKKSFPNRPPQGPAVKTPIRTVTSPVDSPINNIPNAKSDNGLNYILPPPEAGPLSARLNNGANELVRQMARLIEEALKEAADTKANNFGESVDTQEATIYGLRLQIERMKWQHQQEISEIKCNNDRTLREMRASLEVERVRVIEEVRKEAEEEKVRCVLETKLKQWCAWCHKEAFYYCCWNTAYCGETCQQMHWKTHMTNCAQKATSNNTGQSNNNTHARRDPVKQSILREQSLAMPTLLSSAQKNPPSSASANV